MQVNIKNNEPRNGHEPQAGVAQSQAHACQKKKKMPPINHIGVNNLRNHNLYSVNTNPNPYFWGSVSLNLTLTLGWTCLLQVTNTLAALLSLDPGL